MTVLFEPPQAATSHSHGYSKPFVEYDITHSLPVMVGAHSCLLHCSLVRGWTGTKELGYSLHVPELATSPLDTLCAGLDPSIFDIGPN